MIQLIKAATLDYNQQLQKLAQATILKKRLDEPESFFIENAQILSSNNLPNNIRQSAGTLITGALKIKNNNGFLWDSLTHANKASLKDMILGTMIDKQKLIRRAAANIVAAISCIEIPRNEWNGIAQKITSNISNEDLVIKEVSILTIGFICEQLKESNFQFQQPLQETILTGILLGVKDSHNEIAEIAFKALRDGIPSISAILSNNQYRDYLITQIAETIRNNKFIQLGIQCLIEFVRNNFIYMNLNYAEGFLNLLEPFLKDLKNENYCVLAMQFWAVFAKEEKNIDSNPNNNKYVSGVIADRLVQKLLENLCQVEEEDDEDNGISDAASSCLEAIFQGDSSQFQTLVLNFTQNTIKNENWKFRQASIKAFSLLLIGLPSQTSQGLVNVSLIEFIQLLQDSKHYVRYSALKSLALICEETGIVIINHQHFLQILKEIIKHAHTNQNFMRNVCKIVDNLCNVPASVTAFKTIVDQLINVFLESCLQPNRTSGSVNHCLCTIINLIKNSEDPMIAQKYIDYVLGNFSKIEHINSEKRDIFFSGFFTLAQVCLMTIRKYNGSLVVQQLSNLYNLVINYFKKINNVESDGYYVVSALAFFMQKDTRLVDDYWKFILFGFKELNRADVFRASISCVCDFASIYHTAIADKISPLLEDILVQFEGDYKIDLLMLIGELFLNCAQVCWPYLKRVMALLFATLTEIINEKDLNKAEIIQESLIETFQCIYHGLSPNDELIQYIESIFTFVVMTTDKTRAPKLDYFQSGLTLLADLTSFYPNECRKYITNNPIMAQRINTLVRYNQDGSLSQIIKYIRQQFRM